ncbi:H-NS histone family protein [Paraburkholderia sp. RAU2J]|nr:H-NS histone family protein [Paraburkholderia sp. RAU2J]
MPAKYLNPKTGNPWSGHGQAPAGIERNSKLSLSLSQEKKLFGGSFYVVT